MSQDSRTDPFLASMTFAQGVERIFCDCDECDRIPQPIRQAVMEHRKRRKLARLQDRRILQRDSGTGITLYEYTMPPGAEPLVEYGENHRIIFVQRIPQGGIVKKIGKGVIGSKDEEEQRKQVHWEQGDLYFIPSNGGTAVGWAFDRGDETEENSTGTGPAVIIVAKIPQQTLTVNSCIHERGDDDDDDDDNKESRWAEGFRRACLQALQRNNQEHKIVDPERDLIQSIKYLLQENPE